MALACRGVFLIDLANIFHTSPPVEALLNPFTIALYGRRRIVQVALLVLYLR